jgi:hypothetical protein
MTKRAAIYVRVSTDKQTIENQLRELHRIAEHRGWEIVHEYRDANNTLDIVEQPNFPANELADPESGARPRRPGLNG